MTTARLAEPIRADDHVAGVATAPITLVEYGDFQCPYCGMAYPIVQAAQRALGNDLRLVFRNFPLTQAHPHAEHAAEAAESAGTQGKFWEMHDMLFEHQDALTDDALAGYATELGIESKLLLRELETGAHAERVRRDFRGGVRSGVNGTPTFFINGERYDGDWDDAEQFIEQLRLAHSQ